MFVVDITFLAQDSMSETVFVRRPLVRVGPNDDYHLVIPEMEDSEVSLEISRDVGGRFSVVGHSLHSSNEPTFLGGTYDGTARIEIGALILDITALDIDLLLKEQEALDKAGIRIVRRAYGERVAKYPAIVVSEPFNATVSLWPNQPLTIGRARTCGLRLDVPTVSMHHARIGFESGEFWIEDLGSTNGTFIGEEQISGRQTFSSKERAYVSKAVCLRGIIADDSKQEDSSEQHSQEQAISTSEYPVLVSLSEVARPSRVELQAGRELVVGRDPSCGLWLGAPHVSRQHCIVSVSPTEQVTIMDSSTNGTAFDGGLLANGEHFETSNRPVVFNFGDGITVGLCFSREQEDLFIQSGGAPTAFSEPVQETATNVDTSPVQNKPRERKNTTWFNLDAVVLEGNEDSTGVVEKIGCVLRGLTPYGRIAVGVLIVGFLAIIGALGVVLFSSLRW